MSEPIQGEPLNFTKYTGLFGAGSASVGAALTTILALFTDDRRA